MIVVSLFFALLIMPPEDTVEFYFGIWSGPPL